MKGINNTRFVQDTMGAQLRKARGKMKRPMMVQLLKENKKAPVESCAEMTTERLKQWEYGNNPISHEWIPAICDVLDCDTGYLFGEYEEKKREVSDICSITGLSSAAAKTIIGDKYDGFWETRIEALNFLLVSANFDNALHDIVMFKDAEKEAFSLERTREKAISSLSDISEYHPNISFLDLISKKRQAATLCEYSLSNDFTFVIQELKRIVHEEVLDNGEHSRTPQ